MNKACFVPEGLNDNRQGLQPLFRKMKRWRAVGTPRFAAYLTAREMGGGKTQGLKPLPIPAPSRWDGKTAAVEF